MDFSLAGLSIPYFNPRTPCGVRRQGRTGADSPNISIHAPRAGCDDRLSYIWVIILISIHAPRAGCDFRQLHIMASCSIFQSTHPVRGATWCRQVPYTQCLFQSTHPVRGATMTDDKTARELRISIHAPRAGCDGKFDGFTRPNLRKRYKKVSVQPKKRAKKKIKEMLCSHSHIFGWISGAKVPEFPAR